MIYLVLAILFNASLGIIFKIFPRYGVSTLQAIVFNYLTCAIIGISLYGDRLLSWEEIIHAPWFTYALLLGFLFVAGFFISAKCVANFGVAITAMMQKISMLITVVYAIIIFGEPSDFIKWVGVILAAMAIALVNYRKKGVNKLQSAKGWIIILPFITFLMNGSIDTTYFHMKASGHNVSDEGPFTGLVFIISLFIGLFLLVPGIIKGTEKPAVKNIAGGIVLGIANFLSVYCILQALNLDWGGSIIFPVLNTGVILTATFAGIGIFREKLRPLNLMGIFLAIIAIILIAANR
jgi:drug/metabolite transporter (DMT)-like permease